MNEEQPNIKLWRVRMRKKNLQAKQPKPPNLIRQRVPEVPDPKFLSLKDRLSYTPMPDS